MLMLADYALTILGAYESASVYRKHFVLASYELNPLWRKSVDEIRWFNPRHFSLVCIITLVLVTVDQFMPPEESIQFGLGIFYGAFGMVCGRHLTNLMIFRFLNHNPDQISGQVNLSMLLTLKMSQFTYIGVSPLFVATAILAPNNYSAGIAMGVIVLAGVHFIWARKIPTAIGQRNEIVGEGNQSDLDSSIDKTKDPNSI
jgi:hypothetical protein